MDLGEKEFRTHISKSIRLLAASSRLLNFRKRAEVILTRISNFQFEESEKIKIETRIASIRRFLEAGEFGSAKHELLLLSSALSDDSI